MSNTDFDMLTPEAPADYVMKRPRAEVVTAAELLPAVLDRVERGEPPTRWLVDDVPWGRYWFEPASLVVVGGPTGGAKTALMMDSAFRALVRNPTIRVSIANVEDTVDDLLLRGVASHARIPIDQLRDRQGSRITPESLAEVRLTLASVLPRLQLVRRPFTVERAVLAATDFNADIVIFDYLQDLRLEDRDGDAQDNVRRIMPQLRSLADAGKCVVVTAALSRDGLRHIRERAGKLDYHELDSAIFRDASQIEHAMDEGFCLIPQRGATVVRAPGQAYTPVPIELYHVKTRTGQRMHAPLVFDGRYQSFDLGREVTGRAQPGQPHGRPRSGKRPTGATQGKPGTQRAGGDDDHFI
jgi:archaellum biogenesis ATPase FlaH